MFCATKKGAQAEAERLARLLDAPERFDPPPGAQLRARSRRQHRAAAAAQGGDAVAADASGRHSRGDGGSGSSEGSDSSDGEGEGGSGGGHSLPRSRAEVAMELQEGEGDHAAALAQLMLVGLAYDHKGGCLGSGMRGVQGGNRWECVGTEGRSGGRMSGKDTGCRLEGGGGNAMCCRMLFGLCSALLLCPSNTPWCAFSAHACPASHPTPPHHNHNHSTPADVDSASRRLVMEAYTSGKVAVL